MLYEVITIFCKLAQLDKTTDAIATEASDLKLKCFICSTIKID